MTQTFTRMDESTAEQWAEIGAQHAKDQPLVADHVLDLLRSLEDIVGGFAVNQLVHSLQTATRAERGGADEEMVVAALCHDIGKAVSIPNHPRIAAEILRPYVRDEVYQVIRTHQDFQGRHYYHHFGGDPDAREQYRDEPWFSLGEHFADDCDQNSFDPAYDTLPLEHFEPMVREVFAAAPEPRGCQPWRGSAVAGWPRSGLVEQALQLGLQPLGQLVDLAARTRAALARAGGIRGGPMTMRDLDRADHPGPLGHGPLRAADPDRDDRHPGADGHERPPLRRCPRPPGPTAPGALGEDHERLARPHGRLAGAQRLAVRRAPVHREAAEGVEEPGRPAVLPQLSLPMYRIRRRVTQRHERGVDVGPVHRGEDERARRGDVVATLDPGPPEQVAEAGHHRPDEGVEGQLPAGGRSDAVGRRRPADAGAAVSRPASSTARPDRRSRRPPSLDAAAGPRRRRRRSAARWCRRRPRRRRRSAGRRGRVESAWSRRAMSAATWS